MKLMNFLIFFSIVLIVHAAVNFYIYKRLVMILPQDSLFRTISLALFLICALSYLSGRFLEKVYLSHFSDVLIWIGSIWFAYMLYGFLSIVIIDLFRLVDHFTGIFPDFLTANPQKTRQITGLVVFILVSSVTLFGFINSRSITTKEYNLQVQKKAGDLKEIKIVMFSDLHLGTIIGKKYAKKVVDTVNGLSPDIILIPGDLIDEDIEPVMKDGICEELRRLNSKYGVYAITGNHEYIGNAEMAVSYLTKNGINVLRDLSVLIDSSFYLVGREDLSKKQFAGLSRKELPDIMSGIDKSFPIILMDHQPFNLHEAERAGVDLQLSGHTHHGQLWPFNYITGLVYELSWGYKQKSSTHYYVSCGVGGWGPPVRIGSKPEIVTLNLSFR